MLALVAVLAIIAGVVLLAGVAWGLITGGVLAAVGAFLSYEPVGKRGQ